MGGLIRHYTDHLGSYSPVGQPERVVGGLVSLTGQGVVAWQVQRPGNGEWDVTVFTWPVKVKLPGLETV